ncbi:MAG: TSUP family transporter [Waterburya sp.]
MVLNSSAGFLGYLGTVAIDWQLTLSFMFAASLGIFLGAYLAKFVQARHLQKAFAYFLLVMSGFMLWQNRAAFNPSQASRRSPSKNFSTGR